MRFTYRAVDPAGRAARGAIEAASPLEARAALRARGLLPLNLTSAAALPAATWARAAAASLQARGPQLSHRMLSSVTRQLASLVMNGIRVEDALDVIARQGLPDRVAVLLGAIRTLILEGRPVADAFGAQGNAFPRHYVVSLGAGEAAGQLGPVLESLAAYCETRNRTRQSVRLALLYPGFLALISGAIIFALLTQVVPDVVAIYRRRGDDLPLATEVLIGVSSFLVGYGALMGAFALLVVGGVAYGSSGAEGQRRLGQLTVRLPLFGAFERKRLAAQVSSTLAMLVRSGVPFADALRVAASALGNTYVREGLLRAARDIRDGGPVEAALARTGVLPPALLAVIANGLKSGGLAAALSRAAIDEQAELDGEVKALVALLEPAVLLVMGAVVLFIVMAILTPIVNLNSLAGS